MVINAYCEQGEVQEAQRLLNQMRWRRVAPSLKVFNMMIKGFGRARMPAAGEAILREIEGSGSWDMDRLGISPDLVCFTTMIDAWATVGDANKARLCFQRMTRYHKIQPDAVTYGALIKAYARAAEPAKAQAVLAEMAQAGVEPDVTQWTAVVAAWCSARQMAEAVRVKNRMVELGLRPLDAAYHHILWGFGETAQPEQCLDALAQMVANGVPTSAVTWTTFCRAQVENGLTRDAAYEAWLRTVGAAPARGAAEAAGLPVAPPAAERAAQQRRRAAARRKEAAQQKREQAPQPRREQAPQAPKKRWLGSGFAAVFRPKPAAASDGEQQGPRGGGGGGGAASGAGPAAWTGGAGAASASLRPVAPAGMPRRAGGLRVVCSARGMGGVSAAAGGVARPATSAARQQPVLRRRAARASVLSAPAATAVCFSV